MPRRDWLAVPNLVTYVRFLLVPAFVVLHLRGEPGWALVCFAAAAASDGIDGLLARLLDQRTHLGALLDPIADKVLVLSALVTLVLERRLPWWLLGLLLFRDGWIAAGALWVRHKRLEIPTAPSRVGKYATFSLTLLVVLALLAQALPERPELGAYARVVGFVAALCVAVSTLQYFARFGYLLFAPRRRPSEDGGRRGGP